MAIAYRKQVDADTEFALWRMEEEVDTLYRQLQLNEQEKAYVEQLGNGKRHLHWLGTRVLLRTMLDTNEYIDCKIDSHGKPYLANLPYHISLSHSYDYAAVMISKSRPVGIDIEQIKQKVERIAPKFLTPAERATISPENKIEHLYVCWCAKEAVYKCYGQKEISFLDNIALLPFNFATEGSLAVNLHKGDVNLDYKVEYLQYEDYMLGYVKG
ncbi:4'-phosphopantetheinyl transferase family protein [Mucilaginibacter terrae]|uniref:4'-phosphopantetheinyl transferase family protein n=1 Tax=Mucilaginibacter terrae TaxID=1955052 RepID=UPI003638E502